MYGISAVSVQAWRVLLLTASLGFVSGCHQTVPEITETDELSPVAWARSVTVRPVGPWNEPCVAPPPASPTLAAGFFPVGADTTLVSREGACERVFGAVYRTAVRFDIPQGPGVIEKAVLMVVSSTGPACSLEAYEATRAWEPGVSQDFLPATRDPKFRLAIWPADGDRRSDVTTAVAAWAEAARPHLGIVFVGPDESFSRPGYQCVGAVADARLKITRRIRPTVPSS